MTNREIDTLLGVISPIVTVIFLAIAWIFRKK